MPKQFFLPVPLYLQVDCYKDTNEKCGAACTQMVLHDIDPQRPFTKREQDDLFSSITSKPTEGGGAWFNPPQGIRRILNQEKPATRLPQRSVLKPEIQAIFKSFPADPTEPYEFVIYGDSSPETNPNPGIPRATSVSAQIDQIEALSRQLIRTVALRGVAPIVAVREDNAHWVVVNGFWVEDDYRDDGLNQRGRIKAIIIRNPLGRYNYSTVSCGDLTDQEMQVITGHTCELNPNEPDIVPYATWVREYMFSDWAETFVEVCDWSAQVADNFLAQIYCSASRSGGKSAIRDLPARWFRSFCGIFTKGKITPNVAIDRAKRAIEDLNLTQLNPRISTQNALTPYKVKRLDRIDGDYYLVPVGEGNKISAFINITATGEFDGVTVWPINVPRERGETTDRPKEYQTAPIEQDRDTKKFLKAIDEPNDHFTAPFEQHPQFRGLTAGRNSSLSGRKMRMPDGGPLLTITGVTRDETTPYVWRPNAKSFSASRPFHNLKVTVQERAAPITFYHPVDDYCLPDDGHGNITLPSANYLEMVADCIKQKAGALVDEVLVEISRSGTTAMVRYKSNQTKPIDQELVDMKKNVCECLNAHPFPGLGFYRIKAFATNAFLTMLRGGGERDPLGSEPLAGGGSNGIPINPCPPTP
jgi:hypothetical protein